METYGQLIRFDEAQQAIMQIQNKITHDFTNMAVTHVVNAYLTKKEGLPIADFDMLFFAKILESYFSEHEVIAQTLAGKCVGKFYEDEVNDVSQAVPDED